MSVSHSSCQVKDSTLTKKAATPDSIAYTKTLSLVRLLNLDSGQKSKVLKIMLSYENSIAVAKRNETYNFQMDSTIHSRLAQEIKMYLQASQRKIYDSLLLSYENRSKQLNKSPTNLNSSKK
jgi:hypothetical protein